MNRTIFRGIYSDGRLGDGLSSKGIARSFKGIARKIGVHKDLIAGHSTRSGAAEEMVSANLVLSLIMVSGRCKSPKMVTLYARKPDAKKSGMAQLTQTEDWPTTPAMGRGDTLFLSGKPK